MQVLVITIKFRINVNRQLIFIYKLRMRFSRSFYKISGWYKTNQYSKSLTISRQYFISIPPGNRGNHGFSDVFRKYGKKTIPTVTNFTHSSVFLSDFAHVFVECEYSWLNLAFLFAVGTFKLRANVDANLVYRTLDHALKTGYRLIGRNCS